MSDDRDKARAHDLAKGKAADEHVRAHRAVLLRYVVGAVVLVTLAIASAFVSCRYIHYAMPLNACQSCWDKADSLPVVAVDIQANMDRCVEVCR